MAVADCCADQIELTSHTLPEGRLVTWRCAAAGVIAALQANDLPNPVVEVGVANSQKYAVAAARTLQVWSALLRSPPRCKCM